MYAVVLQCVCEYLGIEGSPGILQQKVEVPLGTSSASHEQRVPVPERHVLSPGTWEYTNS